MPEATGSANQAARPLVSLITAVYNGDSYLEPCVSSVAQQTIKDFEWVIIDDGSDDRTPQLLEVAAARDPRIRVLSPGRIGFAPALNHGIERSRGRFIARQDIDDWSEPERLSRQAEFLDANPAVGVVGGWYVLVDELRGECRLRKPPAEHHELVRALARYIPFAHTTVMFRKEAWLQAAGYPLVDDFEDLLLWARMAGLGWRLACIPEILGEHVNHKESFWNRTFAARTRQKKLHRAQLRAIREAGLPLWASVIPLARLGYSCLPEPVTRVLRSSIGERSRRALIGRG